VSQTSAMRLAWGVGGRGRILEAVIEANAAGLLRTKPVLIITSRRSEIETVASRYGIASRLIDSGRGKPSDAFHDAFRAALLEHDVDWLGLTFDKLLAVPTIDALGGRIFNIHMSLLPLFPGFGAVRKALSCGMRVAGVTVHMVAAGMDDGPILGQSVVPVTFGDTELTLGRKLFESAVPLALQIVRAIERGELKLDQCRQPHWSAWMHANQGPFFPRLDKDLVEFARRFCM